MIFVLLIPSLKIVIDPECRKKFAKDTKQFAGKNAKRIDDSLHLYSFDIESSQIEFIDTRKYKFKIKMSLMKMRELCVINDLTYTPLEIVLKKLTKITTVHLLIHLENHFFNYQIYKFLLVFCHTVILIVHVNHFIVNILILTKQVN